MGDLRGPETDRWAVDGFDLHRLAFHIVQVDDEMPSRRGDNVTVSGRDGVRWRPKRLAERSVAWSMDVLDEDPFGRRGLEAVRYNLEQLKRVWYGDGQVTVRRTMTLPGGRISVREGDVELVDALEVRPEQTGTLVRLGVTAVMADPLWREPRRVAGDRSGEFTVDNPGSFRQHDVIVRIAAATNPTLTNLTAGTSFTIDGAFPGWVELDGDTVTAVDDTDAVQTGSVVRTSRWPVELVPGRNRLVLSSGTCELSWRPAYL